MRTIEDKITLFNACIHKISKHVYDLDLRLDELIAASNAMTHLQDAIDRLKRSSHEEVLRDSEEALRNLVELAFDK